MALLTVIDAVRLTGVSRAQLYRYLKAGRISRTPEGLLDTAELLRAGLLLRLPDETGAVSMRHEETPIVSPDVSAVSLSALERLIEILQRELDDARLALREAYARETALIQMLSQMHQQNQRLLDLPRQTAQEPPGSTISVQRGDSAGGRASTRQPGASQANARGAMRQRIVALLADYPDGLTPGEIQARLGAERSLTDTCQGMLRYGLLRRVGRGRYGAAEPG